MTWVPASFQVLRKEGTQTVDGFVQGGLGLWLHPGGDRKYCYWSVTHLNSGLAVLYIERRRRDLFENAEPLELAQQVYDLCDWDAFSDPTGWQNVDPELRAKVAQLIVRTDTPFCNGLGAWTEEHRPAMREIAEARRS